MPLFRVRPARRHLAAVLTLLAVPLGGLALGTSSASAADYNCQARLGTSTPFTQWADNNQYFTLMGGQFETSPVNYGWALTGGAAVVAGNEPWKVAGSTDAKSLLLPAGASASPDDFCMYPNESAVRFFVKAPGVKGSKLNVTISAIFTNGKGVLAGKGTGSVSYQVDGSTAGWAPSPVFTIPQDPASAETAVLVKVTAAGGAWQIDDFEVDPWKSK